MDNIGECLSFKIRLNWIGMVNEFCRPSHTAVIAILHDLLTKKGYEVSIGGSNENNNETLESISVIGKSEKDDPQINSENMKPGHIVWKDDLIQPEHKDIFIHVKSGGKFKVEAVYQSGDLLIKRLEDEAQS